MLYDSLSPGSYVVAFATHACPVFLQLLFHQLAFLATSDRWGPAEKTANVRTNFSALGQVDYILVI